MLRTRWRQARYRLLQHIPFTRHNGLRARARGRFLAWAQRSERVVDWLDGTVMVLFTVSAILGLIAMFRVSSVLAGFAGSFLGLAMFSMAAMLWIDQEREKLIEQVGDPMPTPPPMPVRPAQERETMG